MLYVIYTIIGVYSCAVDANQFVGAIFVKPARSINFVELSFVAVRSGVEFGEVVQGV